MPLCKITIPLPAGGELTTEVELLASHILGLAGFSADFCEAVRQFYEVGSDNTPAVSGGDGTIADGTLYLPVVEFCSLKYALTRAFDALNSQVVLSPGTDLQEAYLSRCKVANNAVTNALAILERVQ